MSLDFLLTSLIVVLLPGTGVIYTLSVGLSRGFVPGVYAAFGCTLGIVPAAVASTLGLATLLHTSALAFQILKYLGVAYLFFMAWTILHDEVLAEIQADESAEKNLFKIALSGMLINILNPKLSLFFLAFLPQFIASNTENPTGQLIFLASVFMLMTFVVFVLYALFAAMARTYVISRPSVMLWMKRSFAGAFVFLGVRLAFENRT